jgi:hypothetical protein
MPGFVVGVAQGVVEDVDARYHVVTHPPVGVGTRPYRLEVACESKELRAV